MGSRSRSRSPRASEVASEPQRSLTVKVFTLAGDCILDLQDQPLCAAVEVVQDQICEVEEAFPDEVQLLFESRVLGRQELLSSLLDQQRSGEDSGSEVLGSRAPCIHLTLVRFVTQRAVSGGEDQCLRLWDVDSGKELAAVQGQAERVIGLEVDWKTQRVLSGGYDFGLRLWDMRGGATNQSLLGCHSDYICGIDVDWDSDSAVTWSFDSTLRCWDLSGKVCGMILKGHSGPVLEAYVDWDTRQALSWGEDNALFLWDLHAREPLGELSGHLFQIGGAQVGWEQRRAMSWSIQQLLLWDLDNPSSACELQGHEGEVLWVDLDPDWRRALTADKVGLLCLWHLDRGGSMTRLEGHEGVVLGLETDWDTERALSWSGDRTLRLWDLSQCRCICCLRGHTDVVNGTAVNWDAGQLLSWSDDRTLCLWDLPQHPSPEQSVKEAVVCPTLSCCRRLEGHTGPICGVEVCWDTRRALSWCSVDKSLRLWNLDTGSAAELEGPAVPWSGVVEVSWSRQRALGWSHGQEVLWCWDLEAGKLLSKLAGHRGSVRCAALKH